LEVQRDDDDDDDDASPLLLHFLSLAAAALLSKSLTICTRLAILLTLRTSSSMLHCPHRSLSHRSRDSLWPRSRISRNSRCNFASSLQDDDAADDDDDDDDDDADDDDADDDDDGGGDGGAEAGEVYGGSGVGLGLDGSCACRDACGVESGASLAFLFLFPPH
jgi:hypothetical protein